MSSNEKKKVTLKEAKDALLKSLNAREIGLFKSDEEMESSIFEMLDNQDTRAALLKGDDPKSWYKPMSVWKKDKFDTTYRKWKAKQ